jgi:hypothetical protein
MPAFLSEPLAHVLILIPVRFKFTKFVRWHENYENNKGIENMPEIMPEIGLRIRYTLSAQMEG